MKGIASKEGLNKIKELIKGLVTMVSIRNSNEALEGTKSGQLQDQ
jgi:hypothetical protein